MTQPPFSGNERYNQPGPSGQQAYGAGSSPQSAPQSTTGSASPVPTPSSGTRTIIAVLIGLLGIAGFATGFFDAATLASDDGIDLGAATVFGQVGWVPVLLLTAGLLALGTVLAKSPAPGAWLAAWAVSLAVALGAGATIYLYNADKIQSAPEGVSVLVYTPAIGLFAAAGIGAVIFLLALVGHLSAVKSEAKGREALVAAATSAAVAGATKAAPASNSRFDQRPEQQRPDQQRPEQQRPDQQRRYEAPPQQVRPQGQQGQPGQQGPVQQSYSQQGQPQQGQPQQGQPQQGQPQQGQPQQGQPQRGLSQQAPPGLYGQSSSSPYGQQVGRAAGSNNPLPFGAVPPEAAPTQITRTPFSRPEGAGDSQAAAGGRQPVAAEAAVIKGDQVTEVTSVRDFGEENPSQAGAESPGAAQISDQHPEQTSQQSSSSAAEPTADEPSNPDSEVTQMTRLPQAEQLRAMSVESSTAGGGSSNPADGPQGSVAPASRVSAPVDTPRWQPADRAPLPPNPDAPATQMDEPTMRYRARPQAEPESYVWPIQQQPAIIPDRLDQVPTYSENPEYEAQAEQEAHAPRPPLPHEWNLQPPQYQPPPQDSARHAATWGSPEEGEQPDHPGEVEDHPWRSIPRAE